MYEIYAKLRDERGCTDYQVAKDLGISRSTLAGWKKGAYEVKNDKLQKIADYFGVTVEYLRTGKNAAKESTSGKKYYFDDATAEKAQELFDNPGMRILFDAARDSKPEDLQMAADLLARLKGTNPDG